jgi:hypothetical protein
MKRIKVLALTLALGVAGMMYAAGSHAQSTTQDNAESCCTGQSCCTGGSCCSTHKK